MEPFKNLNIDLEIYNQYKFLSVHERIEFLYSLIDPNAITELADVKTESIKQDKSTIFLMEDDDCIVVSGYQKSKVNETIKGLIMEGFVLLSASKEITKEYKKEYSNYVLPIFKVMRRIHDTYNPIGVN